MTFSFPFALLLLLALPFTVWVGFPRHAYRRTRDTWSLAVRVLILVLLTLALSGAQIVLSANRLAVVFLVDVSDSIAPTTQAQAFATIRSALDAMRPDDRVGVVLFGANAVVEQTVSTQQTLGDVQSIPLTNHTDLAEAIRLGLALLPSDAARRMVILSDGLPTTGDTESAISLATATGIPIDYIQLDNPPQPEVQLTEVDVPSTVNADQLFDLNLSITAQEPTPAQVTLSASGNIVYQQTVDLNRGTNRFSITLQAGGAGFRDFQVQVDPLASDGFSQNNRLAAFTRVIGAPSVLVLAQDLTEVTHLVPSLEQSGMNVDVLQPADLPIGLASLAQYDSVIVVNVAARHFAQAKMEALQSYVRDLGGGLVFIGGTESYGTGGYFETPIEETLPVETRLRDQQRLPLLTIVYLIDTSGSMGEVGPSGVENIELAKEAIIRSLNFLQPTDQAGVASFNSDGSWIAPIQPVLDRTFLQQLVGTLRPNGGTDILAGMNLAGRDLAPLDSERKHIILLTDGWSDESQLIETTAGLYLKSDITTSVIAIGTGSAPFLADMAQAGQGNYYLIDVVEQIPLIFAQETVLASRSYLVEEPFFPVLTANSPIISGISSIPQLYGYVATTEKDTATVILRGGEYEDPILTSWQYGLGRAVAFTSDATSRWSSDWVGWEGYTRFWSQAVRWTITEGSDHTLDTQVIMQGEQARIVVDARTQSGDYLNGANLQLSLVAPDLEAMLVPLRQVAPGQYEAIFDPQSEGAYLLRLNGSVGDDALNQTSGWVMSYGGEYNPPLAQSSILPQLGNLTNGRDITDRPQAAFDLPNSPHPITAPIWQNLLMLALLLLPVDIAIRRLSFSTRDVEAFRARWLRRAVEATPPVDQRMNTLLTARQRARSARVEDAVMNTVESTAQSGDGATSPPSPPSTLDAPTSNDNGNIGSRLLKRRQNRDGQNP